MINVETANAFDDVENMSDEERKYRQELLAEKRRADEKFLNECKCFKDLIMGREKELAECRKFIEHYVFNLVQLGGAVNSDFLAGMRMAIEMFEELPAKWDNTFARLGKE